MAYTQRHTATFTGHNGKVYTLSINSKVGFGASTDITALLADGIQLQWEGGGADDPMYPIVSSTLDMTFMATSEALLSNVRDFSTSAPSDTYIKLEEDGGDWFWCGHILPEETVYEITKGQTEVSLAFTDGLSLLKEYDFAYDAAKSHMQIAGETDGVHYKPGRSGLGMVYELLRKIPWYSDFLTSSPKYDAVIRETPILSHSMIDLDKDGVIETDLVGILPTVAFNPNAFREEKTDEERRKDTRVKSRSRFANSYDVLGDMLQSLGCKICWNGYEWHVYSPLAMGEDNKTYTYTKDQLNISKLGYIASQGVVTNSTTDITQAYKMVDGATLSFGPGDLRYSAVHKGGGATGLLTPTKYVDANGVKQDYINFTSWDFELHETPSGIVNHVVSASYPASSDFMQDDTWQVSLDDIEISEGDTIKFNFECEMSYPGQTSSTPAYIRNIPLLAIKCAAGTESHANPYMLHGPVAKNPNPVRFESNDLDGTDMYVLDLDSSNNLTDITWESAATHPGTSSLGAGVTYIPLHWISESGVYSVQAPVMTSSNSGINQMAVGTIHVELNGDDRFDAGGSPTQTVKISMDFPEMPDDIRGIDLKVGLALINGTNSTVGVTMFDSIFDTNVDAREYLLSAAEFDGPEIAQGYNYNKARFGMDSFKLKALSAVVGRNDGGDIVYYVPNEAEKGSVELFNTRVASNTVRPTGINRPNLHNEWATDTVGNNWQREVQWYTVIDGYDSEAEYFDNLRVLLHEFTKRFDDGIYTVNADYAPVYGQDSDIITPDTRIASDEVLAGDSTIVADNISWSSTTGMTIDGIVYSNTRGGGKPIDDNIHDLFGVGGSSTNGTSGPGKQPWGVVAGEGFSGSIGDFQTGLDGKQDKLTGTGVVSVTGDVVSVGNISKGDVTDLVSDLDSKVTKLTGNEGELVKLDAAGNLVVVGDSEIDPQKIQTGYSIGDAKKYMRVDEDGNVGFQILGVDTIDGDLGDLDDVHPSTSPPTFKEDYTVLAVGTIPNTSIKKWMPVELTLSNLFDVSDSVTPGTGDLLRYNGTEWVPRTMSEIMSDDNVKLFSLSDVVATQGNTTGGDLLRYNGAQWESKSILETLNAGLSAINGEILQHNGTGWEVRTFATAVANGGVNLHNLADVDNNLSGQMGDILRHNGTHFEAVQLSNYIPATSLPYNGSGVADEDFLKYDSAFNNWVPKSRAEVFTFNPTDYVDEDDGVHLHHLANATELYYADDGQVPVWEANHYGSGEGAWIPGSVLTSSASLNTLTDVTTGTVSEGDMLVYDSDASQWVSKNDIPATVSVSRDDLNNGNAYNAKIIMNARDGSAGQSATLRIQGNTDTSGTLPNTQARLYMESNDSVMFQANPAVSDGIVSFRRQDSNSDPATFLYTDNSDNSVNLVNRSIEGKVYIKANDDSAGINGESTYITVDGSANYIGFYDDEYKFPTSDGTANQVLKTDGAGNLDWADQVESLGDLTGVNIGTPLVTQVLYFDGSDWVNSAVATSDISGFDLESANIADTQIAAASIADLSDVDSTAVASNSEVLYSIANKWYAVPLAGLVDTRIGLATLANLADTPSSFTNGDVIRFDGTDWDAVNLDAVVDARIAASGGGGADVIGDLTDVTLSAETDGDLLQYDGSEWVNVTKQDLGLSAGDLSDVNTTGVANGSILYYNGSSFVNLGVGVNGRPLIVSGGIPQWSTISAKAISDVASPALASTGAPLVKGASGWEEGAFTLPTGTGTANQVLTTDGSGAATWADAGSSNPIYNFDETCYNQISTTDVSRYWMPGSTVQGLSTTTGTDLISLPTANYWPVYKKLGHRLPSGTYDINVHIDLGMSTSTAGTSHSTEYAGQDTDYYVYKVAPTSTGDATLTQLTTGTITQDSTDTAAGSDTSISISGEAFSGREVIMVVLKGTGVSQATTRYAHWAYDIQAEKTA